MSNLDALLAGIVANPNEGLRWLVLADWLDDHGQPERAELLRLHRELLGTCVEPETHPERPEIHARIMELMRAGATPCIPRMTLTLLGGVELSTVFIPPGSFRMGSPEMEPERQDDEQAHVVTLTKGYFLGVSPVTQAQWASVMKENPSHFKGDTLPVENVSWEEAITFCDNVSELTDQLVRLPTEAEWEYATRAGTTTPFYWGDELKGTEANCDGNYPNGIATTGPYHVNTTPVGSYATVSPHPWGLVDVVGNVWEWCLDWYDSYPDGASVDPMGPESGWLRVGRGGGWDSGVRYCRAAFRGRDSQDDRSIFLGFRLAVVPSGE